MTSEVVLSVDIGSSSVRASLYDISGDYVEGSMVSAEHSLRYTPDGGATLDPKHLQDSTSKVIDGAVAGLAGRRVSCVAFSTLWHSLLGLDGRGEPLTSIFTWADRRAAQDVADLRAELDDHELHRRTGCLLHSSYWPAKLRWLRRTSPDLFDRTSRWVSPGEYLFVEFFGEAGVGTSMASATGIFDHEKSDWYDGVLDTVGVGRDGLSEVSDEPSRGLRSEYARRWPELKDVPWYPATGDGACSSIGSGCSGADRVALMVGTSGAMRVSWKTDGFEAPYGTWLYRASRERYVAGGALSDGGNLVEWLGRTLRLPEDPERELAAMEPDAHGLTFLPLLAGERGPGWRDMASGMVAGLSMASKPTEIMRAAMEAVAMRFAIIHETLDGAVPGEERRIIASGGGLEKSAVWRGIMADVLGRPVTLSGVSEASSRGAVLLALEASEGIPPEEASSPEGQTTEPDGKRHEVYLAAIERQIKLYDAVFSDTETDTPAF